MQKKITSLLLTVAMLLSLFTLLPVRAFAADGTTWDEYTDLITQGSGTEDNPYIIDTAGKLAYLAQRVNVGDAVYRQSYYRLTEDLNLSGHNWIPIGTYEYETIFRGKFDGNGHKITGMNVNITSDSNKNIYAGLFGYIEGATLKNIALEGEVNATNTYVGDVFAGGIVGHADHSSIINCFHSGNVTANSKGGSSRSKAGGIAGVLEGSKLSNCYHSGDMAACAGYESLSGGLVGSSYTAYDDVASEAKYCYWDNGDVITPPNNYGIGNATDTVTNVVYFSGTPPTLATEITVGGTATDNLLAALNTNLDELQDETLYKWTGSDGFPTFDSIKWTAPANASITPSASDFDKYIGAAGYADISITKSDGDHTLSDIKNGATVLRKNIDYIIDDNTVTIKRDYLATLPIGNAVLTFDYSGGTDPVLTITITDSTPAVSSDATLSDLTISAGTLSPAFASDITSYTASVAHSIASVNITPTVNQADASVTIKGSAAASGTPTAVGLDMGDNTITIVVTAEDDSTTQTYTLTITRAAATDASITPLASDFDKYIGAAGYADISITKSDGDHTLSDIKNGATALRENMDYIIDGNTVTIKKQYLASLATESAVLTFDYNGGSDPVLTITITDSTPAVSSDATLSDLTISAGTLSPAFASDITSYTSSVAHSIASVNVTATVNQADASVTIKGSAAASGTPSAAALNVGDNTITIVVTAQDDSTTQTYTITITRVAASSSKGGGGGGSSPTYYSASVDTKSNNGEINFDKTRSTAGSKVTITVTPDEGYEIDRLSILDKDGHKVSYTKNVDGTYSFTMPSGDITVNALFTEIPTVIPTVLPEEPPALPFVDVEKSDWYYHSVDYVYRNQWFAGATEEHFEPNTPMSRAMLVTVLWRLEGQADINVNQVFSDVPPGEYYAKGVDWANSREIVQGYGNRTFGPLDNITREQMALILYKFAQFKGYDTSATTNLNSFHDASQVSPWAVDAVKWAVASQILSGKGSGTLDPSGPATRAEVASILMRFANLED